MQAARQVHAEFERPHQEPLPAVPEDAAPIGGADDHGLDPSGSGLLDRHVGKPEIGVAAGQAELSK